MRKKGGHMAKRHMTVYERMCQKIEEEGRKQCFLLYSATGIALWRHYGKRTKTITDLFLLSREIWQECASDHDHSMIQMCEELTGTEIQNGEGKSWKDLPYLNGTLDPGKLSYEQWTYMRAQQVKWVAPQVMACLLIAIHRKYHFGYERCARIYGQIQEIEAEYRMDPKRIRKTCYELTGIDIAVITTKGERNEQT
jgi:hypothetical protein